MGWDGKANRRIKITMLAALAAIAQILAKGFLFQAAHQASPEQIATAPEINAETIRPRKRAGG